MNESTGNLTASNKMLFRFNYNVFGFILVLVAFWAAMLECQAQGDREASISLAHKCAKLHSQPEDGVPVILLHGLTDIKETWNGIYQSIVFLTHRRVCVYDARNHGESGWNDTFNIDVLAEDLGRFMKDMKIEKAAIVGHSMGGTTAMKFALKNPSNVERLFIEDSSPVSSPKNFTATIKFFLKLLTDSLTSIPEGADADAAKNAVMEYIRNVTKPETARRMFRKFPLRQRDGVWQWKMNLDVFIKALQVPRSFHRKMEGYYNGKTFFIYGKISPFKVNADEDAIRKLFPNAEFFGVEGADHAIHPFHPEFLRELIKFLK